MVPCQPILIAQKENVTIQIYIKLTKLNGGVQGEFYQLENADKALAELGNRCL